MIYIAWTTWINDVSSRPNYLMVTFSPPVSVGSGSTTPGTIFMIFIIVSDLSTEIAFGDALSTHSQPADQLHLHGGD